MKPFLALGLGLSLTAAPVWKAPAQAPLGQLSVLELREDDPAAPPLPRPGEEKLGPLDLRSVEPLPDGRGWKLTVQPLRVGTLLIPALDLGDGRHSPPLQVDVPRTVPFGAPWMGVGGGKDDALPYVPFPWAWASLLLVPVLMLILGWVRHWRRQGAARTRHRLRRTFSHHWPPKDRSRTALDEAHAQGRALLVAHYGDEARSWGAAEFRQRQLDPWAVWIQSLDAARFGRTEPPFPSREDLLNALGGR